MVYGPRPDNPNFLTSPIRCAVIPTRTAWSEPGRDRGAARRLGARHPDTRVTVLRPCWMMGPNYVDSVVRYFSLPVVPMLLGYDPLMQFVHEDDCLHAFETRRPGQSHPGVFNVVGRGRPAALDPDRAGGQAPSAGSRRRFLYRLRLLPVSGPDGRPAGGLLRLSPLSLGGRRRAGLGRLRGAGIQHPGGLDVLRFLPSHASLPLRSEQVGEGSDIDPADQTSSRRRRQSDGENPNQECSDLLSGALLDLRQEIRSRFDAQTAGRRRRGAGRRGLGRARRRAAPRARPWG